MKKEASKKNVPRGTSKKVKLSTIKPNAKNPRIIRDDKFYKLMDSIEKFGEKMMPLRPIIVDENKVILGGNMRYKALKELGYKEVPTSWVKAANDLSEEDKKEFIVKDNVSFGDWDFDLLKEEWNIEFLNSVALDIPVFNEDLWEPNMDPSITHNEVTEDDIQKAKEVLEKAGKYKPEYIELCCPKCGHEYSVKEFA